MLEAANTGRLLALVDSGWPPQPRAKRKGKERRNSRVLFLKGETETEKERGEGRGEIRKKILPSEG